VNPLWIQASETRWDSDDGQFACIRRPQGVWYVVQVLPDGTFAEKVTPWGTSLRVLAVSGSVWEAFRQYERSLAKKAAREALLTSTPRLVLGPRRVCGVRTWEKPVKKSRVSLESHTATLRLPCPSNPTINMWKGVYLPRMKARMLHG
jgi:hypothetical protein